MENRPQEPVLLSKGIAIDRFTFKVTSKIDKTNVIVAEKSILSFSNRKHEFISNYLKLVEELQEEYSEEYYNISMYKYSRNTQDNLGEELCIDSQMGFSSN